jgi:hypothetical protein
MAMSNDDILSPGTCAAENLRATFRGPEARGPIIDQEGREIPRGIAGPQFQGFPVRFRQCKCQSVRQSHPRAAAGAVSMRWRKLLDVAFILPGTNIRYGHRRA